MNWTIERTVGAGFAVAVVVAIATAWSAYQSRVAAVAAADRVIQTRYVLHQLHRILAYAQDVETGGRGYVITGDDSFLAPYRAATDRLDAEIAVLKRLAAERGGDPHVLDLLESLIAQKVAHVRQSIALRRDRGARASEQNVATGHGKQIMDAIRAQLGEMEREEGKRLDREAADLLMPRVRAAWAFAGLVLVMVGLVGGVYLLLVRELRARQRVERALEQSEERLRFAVDGAGIGTWHWNIVAGELVWSDHCKALFGVPRGAVMSYGRFLDAVHPDDRERTDAAVLKSLRERTGYDIEYRAVWPNGTIRWLAAKGHGYYDDAGSAVRMEGVVIDVTDRKRAEEQHQRLHAALEAANRELEAFSYSVSHDLRAPLRSIDGFGQMLVESCEAGLDDSGRECLRRIRAATQRMGELIDDLLELARVARGPLQPAPTDLSELAHRIVAELRERDPERRVEVAIEDGLIARADARLLRVALENLLGNAWKFTGRHPAARIEFGVLADGVSPPGNGHFRAVGRRGGGDRRSAIGDQRIFYVRDNGAGFDMAYAAKLFGAFQRLHSASEFDGTGVGLATVQRIIHRHGGTIWAEGAVEQGAAFFFTLGDAFAGELHEPAPARGAAADRADAAFLGAP